MFHWFSIFKVSDKTSVTTEIQKYINFYEKMGNIASSSCGEIVKLNEEFDGMLTKAKETKGSTRSSTVYHMCKDFISTEEQVNKVKNVVAQYIDRSEDEKGRKKEIEEKAQELSKGYKDKSEELQKKNEEMEVEKQTMKETHKAETARLREENQNKTREMEEKLREERQNREREMEEKLKEERQNREREMEKMKAQFIELMKEAVKGSQEASTSQQQSARAANNKTNQQKAQVSDTQSGQQPTNDQQQESGAQVVANGQPSSKLNGAQSISCSRSSSLSSSDSSDNDQPSSKLSEVHPISRSQSLDSLHSNDSDIEIISRSQCR